MATGKEQFAALLDKQDFQMITSFKQTYIDALKHYYFVGGMPEAVQSFTENKDFNEVREIQKISLEPVSLETPIGEEDDSHLGDFIEDEGAMSPNDYAANELLKDELNDVLLELTDREEKVLRLRFGLDDGRTRTLEEVGREFNVTRERIRQIEAKALRKLKHPSRSKRLKDFLDR